MKKWIKTILIIIHCIPHLMYGQPPGINRTKCDTNRISTLLELSREYSSHNIYKAERFANNALKLAKSGNDKEQLMKVYLVLGYLNNLQENERETLEYFFKSLDLATELGDNTTICKIHNNIGASYGVYNDTAKALEHLNIALDLALKDGNSKLISSQYNNLALVYQDAGQHNKALDYIQRSVDINQASNDTILLIRNYVNLSNIFLEIDQPDSAHYYLTKQLNLVQNLDDVLIRMNAFAAATNYYFHIESYEKAIYYADSTLKLAMSAGYPGLISDMYRVLAEANHKTGNYDASVLYFRKINNILDSTKNRNIRELTKSLTAKRDFEIEKREEALKNSTLMIKQRETELTFSIIIGSLLLLLLGLALIYMILLKRSRKGKARHLLLKKEKGMMEKELEAKNKELATNVMEMINRNKILSDAIEKLEGNKSDFTAKNQKLVNRIIKDLKSGLKENVWEEFKIRFQNVHSSFRKNLAEKHKDLTPNEKKLCAFLKLNMSSKEISSLTGQSVHSIEVARTRLRKKLGLNNSKTNLINYINKF